MDNRRHEPHPSPPFLVRRLEMATMGVNIPMSTCGSYGVVRLSRLCQRRTARSHIVRYLVVRLILVPQLANGLADSMYGCWGVVRLRC